MYSEMLEMTNDWLILEYHGDIQCVHSILKMLLQYLACKHLVIFYYMVITNLILLLIPGKEFLFHIDYKYEKNENYNGRNS